MDGQRTDDDGTDDGTDGRTEDDDGDDGTDTTGRTNDLYRSKISNTSFHYDQYSNVKINRP